MRKTALVIPYVATKTEQEAWARYLSDTQHVPLDLYEQIEPFAWMRLQQALKEAKTDGS